MGSPGAQAPTRLGRYELLARLATGGMGEIFLARLEGAAGFEKLVVVKRILPHLADDARFRQMLIAEARIASKMAHSNICQVHELGETDGQLYIVMEYLEGVSLLPLLRRSSKAGTQLDFGLIAGIVQQTADALHYAHDLRDRSGENLGIVHRDVTPSNIFLTESGVAKVLDFGIAKVKDASAHTQTGTVKGKYAYMAPEQLRGGAIDRRADVFGLGIVIFELLALRRLFQRKTDYLTFRAVMEQPIPDVRIYRADVPDAVAVALAKALDRDPSQRFATARQLGAAVLDGLTTVRRAWSQGDLSDYLRMEFANELGRRQAQVAVVVHKSDPVVGGTPSGSGRSTMPLIAHDDSPEPSLDDDDDEFPAVDSTVTELGSPARAGLPITTSPLAPSEFQGVTPPPFGAETSASSAAILPLSNGPGAVTAGPIVVTRRSIVWPLLAVAMVGIAAAALVLVWTQMKEQRANSAPIVIQTSPADDAAALDPPARDAAASTGILPDAGSAPTAKRPTVKPKADPTEADYRAAVFRRSADVKKCAQTHQTQPPKGTAVSITITPRGKAKLVELSPTTLNSTPFGMCVKNVLSDVEYPASGSDQTLNVKLTGG